VNIMATPHMTLECVCVRVRACVCVYTYAQNTSDDECYES